MRTGTVAPRDPRLAIAWLAIAATVGFLGTPSAAAQSAPQFGPTAPQQPATATPVLVPGGSSTTGAVPLLPTPPLGSGPGAGVVPLAQYTLPDATTTATVTGTPTPSGTPLIVVQSPGASRGVGTAADKLFTPTPGFLPGGGLLPTTTSSPTPTPTRTGSPTIGLAGPFGSAVGATPTATPTNPLLATLGPPTNLRLESSGPGPGAVTLTWDPPTNESVTEYQVVQVGASGAPTGFRVQAPGSARRLVLSGLDASVGYVLAVLAIDTQGRPSGPSNTVATGLAPTATPSVLPAAPPLGPTAPYPNPAGSAWPPQYGPQNPGVPYPPSGPRPPLPMPR